MSEGPIHVLAEQIRSDISFFQLAPYEERTAFLQFVKGQYGSGWDVLDTQHRNEELNKYVARIVKEIAAKIGPDVWASSNDAQRLAYFRSKFASITELRYGNSPAEQQPREPVSKAEWVKRYAGMLDPRDADTGYATYARKVRAGTIKP